MTQSKELFALVTGASQGLGRAFALELSRRGHNLILVSLPGEQLSNLANGIKERYGLKVAVYETDLSEPRNVLMFAKWVNEHFDLFMLINNAGKGGSYSFVEASPEYINSIIQLNVTATSLLTHQLLPNLLRRHKAFVLNVSSLAALSPIGYKTVYPASKTFINYFSRGLNEELKGTGVFVSVVHPGAMKTSQDIVERINKQGFLGRLSLQRPEKVAAICISRMLRHDTVIHVNPLCCFMLSLIPVWIRLPLMTKAVKRELKP